MWSTMEACNKVYSARLIYGSPSVVFLLRFKASRNLNFMVT